MDGNTKDGNTEDGTQLSWAFDPSQYVKEAARSAEKQFQSRMEIGDSLAQIW